MYVDAGSGGGFCYNHFVCNDRAANENLPEQNKVFPPVTGPLVFSPAQKINLNALKSEPVHPEVKAFNFDKLPYSSYESSGVKPVKYVPATQKFDFNALPSKLLDVDKLPTKPLVFHTYTLKPPKLISAGIRRVFNSKNAVTNWAMRRA